MKQAHKKTAVQRDNLTEKIPALRKSFSLPKLIVVIRIRVKQGKKNKVTIFEKYRPECSQNSGNLNSQKKIK